MDRTFDLLYIFYKFVWTGYLLSKSDILYFHSYSYFPPPYFSFATYPYTSSTSASNGSCFCCCNQCSTCILVARNSSVSSTASNPTISPANLPAYHPPYHYHPRLPSGGPTTTALPTVGRYHNRSSSSNNISTIPAATVTAAASSNNYNHNHHYQHFLQQSSRHTNSGNNSSHVYSNLSSLVVVGDETNITSTLSPTSSTVTTATTTPIKRVQDEVEDVQMVSIACALSLLVLYSAVNLILPKKKMCCLEVPI